MDKKLYKLMNWPDIEGIVYSECDNPHDILGQHVTPAGILVQAFMPGAATISVKIDGKDKSYPMEAVDDDGNFAVLIPGRKKIKYTLFLTYDNGQSKEIRDPYSFIPHIDRKMMKAFASGICYDIYNILGAHPTAIDGVSGVLFAVWAPNAIRASVIGDFNNWDGRINQMRKDYESGIFDLFIPELWEGEPYQFEIKFKGGMIAKKSDPYAFASSLRPDHTSKFCDINKFKWTDTEWTKNQSNKFESAPISVMQVNLAEFVNEDGDFANYTLLASKLIKQAQDLSYTHIELMPVCEYPLDESLGYQTTGYYCPTSRFGSPLDYKYFINELHNAGIGVIMDWNPAYFPKDDFALSYFDGTPLYENANLLGDTYTFDYGYPQVKNFLIASAMFWAKEYHIDGLKVCSVASMLYLDYGRNPGEWVPNIYGGKENLDAIEFIKHMNSIFKKKKVCCMLIAEETSGWPQVTGPVEEDNLGYDFKWNSGFVGDIINFMKLDPIFRKGSYSELTFSMLYNYSEHFMSALSSSEISGGLGSLFEHLPGETSSQVYANMKVLIGYLYTHPGKKMNYIQPDFTSTTCKEFVKYITDLNKLYLSEPALYEQDYNTEGFGWINCTSFDETILVFKRLSRAGDELIVVANFTPVTRTNYQIGVPHNSKYKEIFNSDSSIYGGENNTNPRLKMAKAEAFDGQPASIKITVPPMGISVFRYVPAPEMPIENNDAAKKNIAKAKKGKK